MATLGEFCLNSLSISGASNVESYEGKGRVIPGTSSYHIIGCEGKVVRSCGKPEFVNSLLPFLVESECQVEYLDDRLFHDVCLCRWRCGPEIM